MNREQCHQQKRENPTRQLVGRCLYRFLYSPMELRPNNVLFSANIVDDPVQPYAFATLKHALQGGDRISLDAYAVHMEGEYPANTWQNKASAKLG